VAPRRPKGTVVELHTDEEALLLDDGGQQTDLWGINLYPEAFGQSPSSSSTR